MSEHPTHEALAYYVMGALDAPGVADVEAHVADCQECAAHLASEARLEVALWQVGRSSRDARRCATLLQTAQHESRPGLRHGLQKMLAMRASRAGAAVVALACAAGFLLTVGPHVAFSPAESGLTVRPGWRPAIEGPPIRQAALEPEPERASDRLDRVINALDRQERPTQLVARRIPWMELCPEQMNLRECRNAARLAGFLRPAQGFEGLGTLNQVAMGPGNSWQTLVHVPYRTP